VALALGIALAKTIAVRVSLSAWSWLVTESACILSIGLLAAVIYHVDNEPMRYQTYFRGTWRGESFPLSAEIVCTSAASLLIAVLVIAPIVWLLPSVRRHARARATES
jgi:hypothetical protein